MGSPKVSLLTLMTLLENHVSGGLPVVKIRMSLYNGFEPIVCHGAFAEKKLGHDHKYVRRASIVANECRIHIDFSFTLQFFLRKKLLGQEIMIIRHTT